MNTRTYTVTGMTCGHCVRTVTEEVSELAGVTDVQVDLDTGTLTVIGDTTGEAVVAAVVEAGYQATPRT
jgi:copper chaperone